MEKTLPRLLKPEGIKLDPKDLAAGRYGTHEMAQIWGPEKTFEYSLHVQAQAAVTLSNMHPEIIPPDAAQEILAKANLQHINPDRIRELEEKTGHDVIAINTALEEVLSEAARPHVNKTRTSADTTQTARALQLRDASDVIIDSLENLRDIVLEKAVEWRDVPHMDVTHLYDAMPTVAGRPFVHYAEILSENAGLLTVFKNLLKGKWSDATGNHHGAKTLGIDGIALEQQYCEDLDLERMTASAQVPDLEREADLVFALARTSETLNNLAKYIAWGRSDDVNVFVNASPQKKKGSSAMPHKDAKNGNPTVEEQVMSIRNYMHGWMITALNNCEFPYARNLAASANSRIQFEDGFKFLDHGIRRLTNTLYWLGLNKERCEERVLRSYGAVTSAQVMTYLTDPRFTERPMARSEAHDLAAKIATEAWTSKRQFRDIALQHEEITSRLPEETIRKITDPLQYIGESQRIIDSVVEKYYKTEAKKLFLE